MKLNGKRSIGTAAGDLPAPEPLPAPETPYRGPREPAPAGSLYRKANATDLTADSPFQNSPGDDPDYIPRRGRSVLQQRLRRLPRSSAGRIFISAFVLVLFASLAVAAAAVRYFVLNDTRFRIASADDIQVIGNTHLTRDQLLAVFAPDLRRSIFHLSLPERRADVERLPWVAHATVMRLLPHTLRVAVVERTPVAFARQGTQLGLVDASGVLLDMPPADAGDPQYSFPVLTGVTAQQTPADRASRMELYHRFLTGLPPAAADDLSEVDVTDPEDIKAVLPAAGGDLLVHFGQDNFDQRYADLQAHLAEWHQQYPRLASADMRYEGKVVLQMKPASAVTDPSEGSVTTPVNMAAASPVTTASTPPPGPLPHVPVLPVPPTTSAPRITPVANVASSAHAASKLVVSTPPTLKLIGDKSAALQPSLAARPAARSAAKPAARPAARPAAKPATKPKPSIGRSASNDRLFAALAAQRRASETASHANPGGAR